MAQQTNDNQPLQRDADAENDQQSDVPMDQDDAGSVFSDFSDSVSVDMPPGPQLAPANDMVDFKAILFFLVAVVHPEGFPVSTLRTKVRDIFGKELDPHHLQQGSVLDLVRHPDVQHFAMVHRVPGATFSEGTVTITAPDEYWCMRA